MTCYRVQIGDTTGIVTVGGPVREIMAGGHRWYFEMHHYCGPMPINKRTGRERQGSAAFWDAVTRWAQQGERVTAAGVCIVD